MSVQPMTGYQDNQSKTDGIKIPACFGRFDS